MSSRPFVHLHCHSHYSLLDGASKLPELVQRVKTLGMPALALTDHGNLYGAVEFLREAKYAGIVPIVGLEAYVAPGRRTEKTAGGVSGQEHAFHLTLLARNAAGFRNLMRLSSLSFLEGFYYKPRIDKEILERHAEGLICLSGCASAEFSDYILHGKTAEAERLCAWYQKIFGAENFYVEIQDNGVPIQKDCASGAIDIARRMGLPLVGTSDAHYLTREDAAAHDVLLCINTGKMLDDPARMRFETDEFYVRSPEEMYEAMPGQDEALAASARIAEMVEPHYESLGLGRRCFPSFSPPAGKTPEDYLRELCEAGLHERYGDQPGPEVLDRLDHELGIINRMGFASYFLIVWDFVRYAREQGIPALARGSACGAIVSYLLRLSNVCPLQYDLLFERFLDPNRSEAPDIDIDLCQDRRYRVIEYVRNKYGDANVAQIGTFGTLKAKAAIKDVGRVMNIPLARVELINKLVPTKLNITLEEAIHEEPQLKRMADEDPEVARLLDFARRLEGMNRNISTHAAGVVIADRPLEELVPLQKLPNKDKAKEVVTTQWEMGDIEKVGLLKMDFLGLRNLTTLDAAVRLINQRHPEAPIDLDRLPLDDPKTFEIFQRGETKGVFQFESGGIRDLLIKMRPDRFTDIIATNALYRPGPLNGGMVDEFVDVKNGRKQAVYLHPVLKEVLEETYGIMVFQEQVMRILNRLGGIELSRAYATIKAISKKKAEVIAQGRDQFIKGAVERGLERDRALKIFDLIEYFGGYGFNKCVVGDTTLIDATTGERTTARALFENPRPFHVHALAEDGKLVNRLVTDVASNGPKPVFELRTSQGRRIVATGNHPFRTIDGWENLEDLKPGDRIAAPRRLKIAGGETWPRHELIALAGLLSEGNTCHPTCLYFYNNSREFVDDFVEAVEAFPETVAKVTSRRGRFEVCVNTGRDARFTPGHHPWNAVDREPAMSVLLAPLPSRSGAYRWAERLGILGRLATEKTIPDAIFRLRDEALEIFLGRLWSGDGHFASKSLAVPFYATSSAQLARDLSTLLLRLGMINGVHGKSFKYRGTDRPGYTVHLLGEGSIEAFVERIVPHVVGRDAAVTLLKNHLTCNRGETSKDTIPTEIRAWIDGERQRAGLGWRDLQAQSGVSMAAFYWAGPVGKLGFRRRTIARLAEFFQSRRLAEVASADVFWDRIVAIEPRGDQETFDLTVAVDHNFVADGLIVHNSHSTAYAQVAYQTAYLKAHYPTEFMAAVLSSEMEGSERDKFFVEHIEDCRRMEIEVQPPNINEGELTFRVAREGQIHFGLGAIKGVGFKAVEAIVKAREEHGPFHSLEDFFERISTKEVGAGCVETLIHAGAFDCLGARRSQLLAILPKAMQSGQNEQEHRRHGQLGLFDIFDGPANAGKANGNGHASPPSSLPDVPELSDAEKLANEKKALGFYMSSHPLARHADLLAALATHRVADLAALKDKAEVILGGMIVNVALKNVQKSRSGLTRMAKFSFEDLSGSTGAMLWPEEFARMADLVKNDQIVFVKGTLDRRRDPAELIVSRIIPRDKGPDELARGVVVRLHKGLHQAEDLERLLRAVRIRPGNLDLYLEIVGLEQVRRAIYKAGSSLRVRYDDRLCLDLENAVGPGLVRLLGHGGATTRIGAGTRAADGHRRTDLATSLPPAPDLEPDDLSDDDSDDL